MFSIHLARRPLGGEVLEALACYPPCHAVGPDTPPDVLSCARYRQPGGHRERHRREPVGSGDAVHIASFRTGVKAFVTLLVRSRQSFLNVLRAIERLPEVVAGLQRVSRGLPGLRAVLGRSPAHLADTRLLCMFRRA
jgi:hypothetical protein